MTHEERALQVAADCQRLARNLAPYQNRGDLLVVDAPTIPTSALLKEMQDRVNAVRAEYGLPPARVGAMLTVDQVTEMTSTLLNAGNLLQHDYTPKLCNSTNEATA